MPVPHCPLQIYPPCRYTCVHCRLGFEIFTHIQTNIVSHSLWLKPLPAATLPEVLFTLKSVIFFFFFNSAVNFAVWAQISMFWQHSCLCVRESRLQNHSNLLVLQTTFYLFRANWHFCIPVHLSWQRAVCYSCYNSAYSWLAGVGNFGLSRCRPCYGL